MNNPNSGFLSGAALKMGGAKQEIVDMVGEERPTPSSDVVERLERFCNAALTTPALRCDPMLTVGHDHLNKSDIREALATIERLSAERLQLREALVEARQFVEKYAARGKQDQHGKQLMLEQIDEALSNTEDTRHD